MKNLRSPAAASAARSLPSSISHRSLQWIREELLECSICAGIFNDPRLLPCQHSFCLACLERISPSRTAIGDTTATAAVREISCPLCRRTIEIPAGGLREIPVNRFFGKVIEFLSTIDDEEELEAGQHQRSGVEALPVWRSFCRHHGAEWRMMASPEEDAAAADDIAARVDVGEFSISASARLTCRQHHGSPYIVFCEESACSKPLCLICAVTDHRLHKCVDLSTVANRLRRRLSDIMSPTSRHLAALRRLTNIARSLELTESSALRARDDVNRHCDDVIRAVSALRDQLLLTVDKFRSSDAERLAKYQREAESDIGAIQSAIRSAEELMSNGSDVTVVEITEKFENALTSTLADIEKRIESRYCSYSDIRFEPVQQCSVGVLCEGETAVGRVVAVDIQLPSEIEEPTMDDGEVTVTAISTTPGSEDSLVSQRKSRRTGHLPNYERTAVNVGGTDYNAQPSEVDTMSGLVPITGSANDRTSPASDTVTQIAAAGMTRRIPDIRTDDCRRNSDTSSKISSCELLSDQLRYLRLLSSSTDLTTLDSIRSSVDDDDIVSSSVSAPPTANVCPRTSHPFAINEEPSIATQLFNEIDPHHSVTAGVCGKTADDDDDLLARRGLVVYHFRPAVENGKSDVSSLVDAFVEFWAENFQFRPEVDRARCRQLGDSSPPLITDGVVMPKPLLVVMADDETAVRVRRDKRKHIDFIRAEFSIGISNYHSRQYSNRNRGRCQQQQQSISPSSSSTSSLSSTSGDVLVADRSRGVERTNASCRSNARLNKKHRRNGRPSRQDDSPGKFSG